MPLELSRLGDVNVVHLPEDLFDPLAINMMQQDLLSWVRQDQPSQVVVDFARVNKCGSAALAALTRLAQRVRSYGGDVRLCRMNERVRQVFDVCRLIGTVFELDEQLPA